MDELTLPGFPEWREEYCMEKVRCLLCRFRFEEDETIIALRDNSNTTPYFPFHHFQDVDCGNGINIHMCGEYSCIRAGVPIRAFHKRCHTIKPDSFSSDFEHVTAYSYSPSYRDDCLRAKRISNIAARDLCQNTLQKLPLEVCNIIAEYIVLELATTGLQEILSSTKPIKETHYKLDLNKDIYVAYQAIEGVSYIQQLTHRKLDNKRQLIYKAHEKQNIRAIYVAFDYLGVRNIYFGNPPADYSSWAGSPPYWSDLPTTKQFLICTHDGLKLRSVEARQTAKEPKAWPMAWPSPGFDYNIINLYGSEMNQFGFRMDMLDCHSTTVSGYSCLVCQESASIKAIIAHHHDRRGVLHQDPRIYESYSIGTWIHMPMDKDEHLDDVWLVSNDQALMFVTNTERASVFGHMYSLQRGSHPKFRRVFSRSSESSKLYLKSVDYSNTSSSITAIGVDKNLQQDDAKDFVTNIRADWSPYPPSIMPSGSFSDPRLDYFSKCRLEDVSMITCCINKKVQHKPIVGMMLHYHGGRRACAGEFRHDWAVEPLIIDQSNPLRIVLYRDSNWEKGGWDCKGIYVMAILVNGEMESDSAAWETISMPWYGWIEWWFSDFYFDNSHCHVSHCN